MLARASSLIARIVIMLTVMTAGHSVFAQMEPLKGTVVGKSDKPLVGVQVVLRSSDSAEAIEEITTEKDGVFSIPMESLRPGYELHLRKDGYDDVVLPINPQQLVIATISVTMLRTPGKPGATPTPKPKDDRAERIAAAIERRERAIRLFNDAVEKYEDEEDPKQSKIAAMQMFREAASIDPTFPEPLEILARIAIKSQNWAEASRYSEALVRIDPDDEEAINNLYISLVIMRHFLRVGEAAKRLISIDPEKIAFVEAHAAEFYRNNQFVMSRALYQTLTEIAPDMPNGYLNLGLCCAALGDTEATRAAFEKFIELAPEDHQDLETIRQQLAALDATEQLESTEEPDDPPEEPE